MAATFDDGILTIYSVENIAEPGSMPVTGLVEKAKYYFGYETVGINRFYTALQANRQIESVVHIPGWNDIGATDVCVLENGNQYIMPQIQPTLDDDNLRITRLSLERVSQEYVIKT